MSPRAFSEFHAIVQQRNDELRIKEFLSVNQIPSFETRAGHLFQHMVIMKYRWEGKIKLSVHHFPHYGTRVKKTPQPSDTIL